MRVPGRRGSGRALDARARKHAGSGTAGREPPGPGANEAGTSCNPKHPAHPSSPPFRPTHPPKRAPDLEKNSSKFMRQSTGFSAPSVAGGDPAEGAGRCAAGVAVAAAVQSPCPFAAGLSWPSLPALGSPPFEAPGSAPFAPPALIRLRPRLTVACASASKPGAESRGGLPRERLCTAFEAGAVNDSVPATCTPCVGGLPTHNPRGAGPRAFSHPQTCLALAADGRRLPGAIGLLRCGRRGAGEHGAAAEAHGRREAHCTCEGWEVGEHHQSGGGRDWAWASPTANPGLPRCVRLPQHRSPSNHRLKSTPCPSTGPPSLGPWPSTHRPFPTLSPVTITTTTKKPFQSIAHRLGKPRAARSAPATAAWLRLPRSRAWLPLSVFGGPEGSGRQGLEEAL